MDRFIVAIANHLAALFTEATIYDEAVPQNFRTPSFYIRRYNTVNNWEIASQYAKREDYFEVIFFPDDSKEKNPQMLEVEDIIHAHSRYLKFEDGSVMNIFDMNSEIVDETLQITFKLIYQVYIEKAETKLGQLTQNGVVMNGNT